MWGYVMIIFLEDFDAILLLGKGEDIYFQLNTTARGGEKRIPKFLKVSPNLIVL